MRYFFSVVLFFTCFGLFGQALPISIDGRFDDWQTSNISFSDAAGDGGVLDLISFKVSNDSSNLYILLELSESFRLNTENELYLEIDGDNNASTGYAINGIGAELGWKFGGRYGFYNTTITTQIEHPSISFVAAPTVTSNIFEIAIARDAQPTGSDFLFTSDTVKICFVDQSTGGDYMPNQGTTFTYVFDQAVIAPPAPIDLVKADTSYVRLMTFNTLFNGLTDQNRIPAFGRIFQAIQPDIITFNECWDTQYYEAADFLDTYLPLQANETWNCWKLDGGNITCSHYTISQNWHVLADRRITASLVDLPAHFSKDLLVVNAHLKCCDGDEIRQREADAFASFIIDAKSSGGVIDLPEGTPFLISGDLNLVGEAQQLETLISGDIQDTAAFGAPQPLDWDGTDLHDIISNTTDTRMTYTWRDETSSYWPGRLDFAIASDVNLQVKKAFTLETAHMSAARLMQYGLLATDCEVASDHLPKITDFAIPLVLETSEIEPSKVIKLFPNPSTGKVNVQLPQDGTAEFFNVAGKCVKQMALRKGTNEITLDAELFTSGVYLINFESKDFTHQEKLILH